MTTPPEKGDIYESAMVNAVREMSDRLVKFERQVTQRIKASTRHADKERRDLRAGVDATIAAFRKDMYETTIALQLAASQHKDEHVADTEQRTQRQHLTNIWWLGFTLLGIVNALVSVGLLVYILSKGGL